MQANTDTISELKNELEEVERTADELLDEARMGEMSHEAVEAFVMAWAKFTHRLDALDGILGVHLPKETYPSKDDSIN